MQEARAVVMRDESRVLAARAAGAIRAGRRDEAAALARRALSVGPLLPETLSALSSVALALGDEANAAVLMEVAVAGHSGPVPAAWHSQLGDARARQGRSDDALAAYRKALAAEPKDVGCLRAYARALESVHDVPAAASVWRRVTALIPGDWEALNGLGAALMEQCDWDGADAAFAAASAAAPGEPTPVVNRAALQVRRGRPEAAVATLRACAAEHPELGPAHVGLGFALRELRRFDEAESAFRRGIALSPGDASASCGLSRALLEAGDAAGASDVAQAYLRLRPGHAGALAAEVLARMSLGDSAEVERLLDDRLVVPLELAVPEGFRDLAAFNRALAAHVVAHPTLVSSPASHATTAGKHSGSLLVSPLGPVAAFERALHAAVAGYSRSLPADAGHPFVAGRPRSAFFQLWGVVMERGGHQTPHIHPSAWLSGVYYAELPEAIRAGDGPEGWLEFGEADRSFPSRLAPRSKRVRPVEGTLLLFPSYFCHRTIPFDAPGHRISLAFDLVPACAPS